MPYDPNWPQNGHLVDADRFRDQFGSLKTLIDAIQGGITNVVVDAVNTVPSGSPANVGVSLSGTELHFTFDLPQGQDGPTGTTGQPGEVSQIDLNNAMQNTLGQTSSNSNGVGSIAMNVDPDYNQNQIQGIVDKLEELIQALRR